MRCNVGTIDRIIRGILGVALLVWGLVTTLWWAIIVGVIFTGTAAIRFCPLYRILGVSTCKTEDSPSA